MSQQKVHFWWFRQYSIQSENVGATAVVPVAPVGTSLRPTVFLISYDPNSKWYLKVWALAASSSRWIWQNRTVQFVILLCKAPFRIFFRLLRSAFGKNCHIWEISYKNTYHWTNGKLNCANFVFLYIRIKSAFWPKYEEFLITGKNSLTQIRRVSNYWKKIFSHSYLQCRSISWYALHQIISSLDFLMCQ